MTRRLDEAVARTRALVSTRSRTGLTHQDANADVGTIGSDDAVNFDPRSLLAALQKSGVHIVVIGQVAGIVHGSRELTGDLDLLWAGNPSDAEALAGVFSAAGADLADDQGSPVPCTREAFLLPKVVFTTPYASGDCCTPALPWGHLPIRDILARSTRLPASDTLDVAVISRDDLIRMRRAPPAAPKTYAAQTSSSSCNPTPRPSEPTRSVPAGQAPVVVPFTLPPTARPPAGGQVRRIRLRHVRLPAVTLDYWAIFEPCPMLQAVASGTSY